MRRVLQTSVIFFPKIHKPSLIMRRHNPTQTDRHSTKYPSSTPQKYQSQEKQRKPEKALYVRRDQGDMTMKCNMISWIGSRNRKKYSWKNW